ncbi:hypothetical protein GCM10008018_24580 [Paenibacillus marchantiophytorum]|uniref:DUF7847 domain-containing protein n=1 Tax=Paenibacillus marchantiophytorum TaxID=1619310 RepID=A0ABQ1EN10_9BACL|nr:hypothetical protein [Paenibacillus marchantiophytorum]GFZ78203.1 hypothetical protein GCM10008018_24580 [Paenibacillus marchantiophytorum]
MQNTSLRPMGIGRILDRSFQLYRKHFVTLTLIMLILYGPFYLLEQLLTYQETAITSTSILDQIRSGKSLQDMFETGSYFQNNPSVQDENYIGRMLLLVLVLLPIMLLGLFPTSVASVVHLVKASLFGEEIPSVGQLLRKSFRRFWPLAGSTFLDGLIMVGLYIGLAIIIVIFALIFVVGGKFSNAFGNFGGGAVALTVVFFILLTLGVLFGFCYFFLRWSYYLPFVALGEESIGIGRSWKLTRKSFWRLFGMYLVLSLILYLFLAVIQLIIAAVFGMGLWSQLLQSLVSIVVMSLWYLPYAVSFFDLKVRNEGLGLEGLMEQTMANPALDNSEELEPFDPFDDPKPIDLDKKNE